MVGPIELVENTFHLKGKVYPCLGTEACVLTLRPSYTGHLTPTTDLLLSVVLPAMT